MSDTTTAHAPLMAPTVESVTQTARLRAMANHPCCGARDLAARDATLDDAPRRLATEDGSMATEYGLIVVVAAVICSLLIDWASNGGIFSLLETIIGRVAGFLF